MLWVVVEENKEMGVPCRASGFPFHQGLRRLAILEEPEVRSAALLNHQRVNLSGLASLKGHALVPWF